MDYDVEIARIKETLALVVQTQTSLAKAQAQIRQVGLEAAFTVDELRKRQQEAERRQAEMESWRVRMETWQEKIEHNLAEITDKLNGLIGYVGGKGPNRPPAPLA